MFLVIEMKVNLLEPYGNCIGVSKAINKLLEARNKYPDKNIYCLGKIVHNDNIMETLKQNNITIIEEDPYKALDAINDGVVVFPAHGMSNAIKEKAKNKNLICIDATCRYVNHSTNIIKEYLEKDYDIIFIGTRNHAEANAILSLSKRIHLITSLEEAKSLNLSTERLFLTNQTAMSKYDIKPIHDYLKEKYPNIVINKEICAMASIRQEKLYEVLDKSDAIIVIGDKQSNNCTALYKIAKIKIKDSFFVSSIEELNLDLLRTKKNIYVTSGTSTPTDLVINFVKYLEKN